MIDGSGTIDPAALNTPGKFLSTQSAPLGDRLRSPCDSRTVHLISLPSKTVANLHRDGTSMSKRTS